jgi:hypothetical protein
MVGWLMNAEFEKIVKKVSSAEILFQHLLKGIEENHAKLVITDILGEIRTEQLPNRSPERYRYINHFGHAVFNSYIYSSVN